MTGLKKNLLLYAIGCGFVAIFGLFVALFCLSDPVVKTVGLVIAAVGFILSMSFLGAYSEFNWFHIPMFRRMRTIEREYRKRYGDYKW